MSSIRHIFLAVILCIFCMGTAVYAVPAKKGIIELCQPDGRIFSATITGDEFGHIIKTADGAAIIQDPDGYWSYAYFDDSGTRFSSGIHVGERPSSLVMLQSRQIPYALVAEKAAVRRSMMQVPEEETPLQFLLKAQKPRTKAGTGTPGKKHGIIVLAQYNDVSFKYSKENFQNLLSMKGYADNGATGSAIDYFNAQFNGSIEFSFDVSSIVTLPKKRNYYGGNNADGDDKHPGEMIRNACELADAEIDFSKYDDDNDGVVDNVFVFFAGGDEAEGAGDDCIWSHAWDLRAASHYQNENFEELVCDGKKIGGYACTSELTKISATRYVMAGIGTFCHEYSHTFGLPDFYDTDYEGEGSYRAAGLWTFTSLMDGGNQNNGGNTPPFYNAIQREYLGLGEAEIIQEGSYSLEPVSENGRYLRINTINEGEYYLLECRSGKDWDAHINAYSSKSAQGLLIYHIDKSVIRRTHSDVQKKSITSWERWENYNEVNANPEHQCADLIEADGRQDEINDLNYASLLKDLSGLFFPFGNTAFTANGKPAFTDWDGNASPLSIRNIRMDGDKVLFSVSKTDNVTPKATQIAVDSYQDAAILHWETDIRTDDAAVVSSSLSGKEIEVAAYESGKYCFTLEGLSPGKEYTVRISYKNKNGEIENSSDKTFTTATMPMDYAYTLIDFGTGTVNTDGSFSKGIKIPLRISNAPNKSNVSWYLDEERINVSKDGYYHLLKSGRLKAVIDYKGGGREIIIREIKIQ